MQNFDLLKEVGKLKAYTFKGFATLLRNSL